MTRLYTRKIDNCLGCPNCTSDQNITRFECCILRKMICWQGSAAEEKIEKENIILDGCRLPIYEEPESEDEEEIELTNDIVRDLFQNCIATPSKYKLFSRPTGRMSAYIQRIDRYDKGDDHCYIIIAWESDYRIKWRGTIEQAKKDFYVIRK